ncbi:MAG: hypothetical protein ACOH1X_02940 [Kaistella sp.]
MNIWHKRFVYLQIVILLLLAVVQWFFPQLGNVIMYGTIVFFVLEIGILEAQRKEQPEAVFYQKSGFFAFADLLTVIWFLIYVSNLLFDYAILDPRFHTWLFLYIALRKMYILKNYSYAK